MRRKFFWALKFPARNQSPIGSPELCAFFRSFRDFQPEFDRQPMSKIKAPSANSKGGDADPAPPRGLSKAEKSDFRRVCDLRRQAGNPVQPIESDLVADYVQTRSRLALWQKKLRHGVVSLMVV